MSVRDPGIGDDTRLRWWATFGAGIWLVFLAPAVQEGWSRRDEWTAWAGLLALLAFCVVYVWSFAWGRGRRHRGDVWRRVDPAALGIVLVLLALSVVMVLALHASGLAAAVYVSVAGITLLPPWLSIPLMLALAAGSEWMARAVPGWDGADGIALSVALASFAVWGVWTALRRSRDLVAAREENAQLMVAEERARMARDLHDILGHSLTVIAVKAELADRLVDVDPDRARTEVADIQRLARDALGDVRRTVDGVRELSLPAEIARARAALAAAEIEADLPGSTEEVPSDLRELFAWALREGVTNVVRHSGAKRCFVTLTPSSITVRDDGRGLPSGAGAMTGGGHGLVGLRERATLLGARVVVESPAGGGLSLAVVADRMPLSPKPADSPGRAAVQPALPAP